MFSPVPGWITWLQWGVILACFCVIYYRLPEPRLFDRHLNELSNQLQSVTRKQEVILEQIAHAEHLDAPLVVLVRRQTQESEKWFVENHGSGPAIDLRCFYGKITKTNKEPFGESEMHLAASLRGGDGLPVPVSLGVKIEDLHARSASVAEKTRELAAEGYRYSDLYGDPDALGVIFNFESARGKRYSTTMTWRDGQIQVGRDGYA